VNEPIILSLPYPISENHYKAPRIITLKGTRKQTIMWYLTPEAKVFIAACQKVAYAAGLKEPLTGRVDLSYRLYPHRPLDYKKRMRDLGPEWDDSVQRLDIYNAIKVAADALQGIVYVNDKQIYKGALEVAEPDEYGARLIVYVKRLPSKVTQQPLGL